MARVVGTHPLLQIGADGYKLIERRLFWTRFQER